jgi:hypothetical protein
MFENSKWANDLPNENLELCQENLDLFFETMYERQLIWKRRFIEKKERPWTNNKIFQESKFTNVYRELDRNSQWQIKNILLDDTLDLKNLIWKMMVFRFFNNPETFTFQAEGKCVQISLFGEIKSGLKQAESKDELISATKWRNGIPDFEEYDEDEFSRFIAGIRSCGKNPYTTAYLINSQATPGQSRDYCYTRVVIPTLHKKMDELINVVQNAKQPEDIINYLKTLPAVADFIAHEFYQDFTYIQRYTNREFMKFDQNDFTNVGPGASIGIRLIYPNLKNVREQKQAIYRLKDIADEYLKKIGRKNGELFPYLSWDKKNGEYFTFTSDDLDSGDVDTSELVYKGITLHQIEMWLCEFQKYWKMMIGKGKQRSKFVPRSNEIIKR